MMMTYQLHEVMKSAIDDIEDEKSNMGAIREYMRILCIAKWLEIQPTHQVTSMSVDVEFDEARKRQFERLFKRRGDLSTRGDD